MIQRDYLEFSEMLQAVADLHSRALTPAAIMIYWRALEHAELAVVREALHRHVTNADTGQFMPKPADLLRMMEGSSQDRALQAWAKVDRAVRSIGPHQSVAFDDGLIHRVLAEMGGWIMLGSKTDDEWPFVAREFEQRYRGYVQRQERPEYPPLMIGLFEGDNRREGHAVAPPFLVGDGRAAVRTMLAGDSRPLIGLQQMDPRQAAAVMKRIADGSGEGVQKIDLQQ